MSVSRVDQGYGRVLTAIELYQKSVQPRKVRAVDAGGYVSPPAPGVKGR
ncbi:hypothetical protein ACSV9I_05360 [Rhizobium sp. G187]